MKRLISFAMSIFWFGPCLLGQTIQWTKSIDLSLPAYRDEYVDQILQLEDSSYIALARVDRWGYVTQNGTGNFQMGMALVALTKNGDTLFVRNLKVSGTESNSLCKTQEQHLLIAFSMDEDTAFGAKIRIYKTDYLGNTIWMCPLSGISWQDAWVKKIIPSREGGAYVIGQANTIFPGNSRDGFLAKINDVGQLDFALHFTDSGFTSLHNIEEMKDGNYLLSGTAGQRIWSCVVDSTGFQLSDKTWFKTLENGAIQDAQIKIGHGDLYRYGFGSNTSRRTAIIKYDENGDSLWVKRSTLSGRPPHISLDGGYARSEGYVQGKTYLTKYRSDSTQQWRILLSDYLTTSVGLSCMAYDGQGSAVLAGNIKPSQLSNNRDMYFIKVSNVGYPVNPLSTKPPVENASGKLPELLAYPNPAQNYFYLQGIKGRTKLGLYNLQGHLLKEYTIHPNDAIPVWQLPTGLYIWKAEDGKRVCSGKILKED
jgi:Secretion system C-terminal sorting domain